MAAPGTKLFVGHLPDGCTNNDLLFLFGKYGTVTECNVIHKYGFVHFSSYKEADDAIKVLNNYNFRGSFLSVEQSKSKFHDEPGVPGTARGTAQPSFRGRGGRFEGRPSRGGYSNDYQRFDGPPPFGGNRNGEGDYYDRYGGEGMGPRARPYPPYERPSMGMSRDEYSYRPSPYSVPSREPYPREPAPLMPPRDLYERRPTSYPSRSDYLYSRRSPPSQVPSSSRFLGVLSKQAGKGMAVTSNYKKDKSLPKSIKGCHTGPNVLKEKNIRTNEDGTQNFEDCWTKKYIKAAIKTEDNLKFKGESFQKMIHKTPDVQRDSEINKLKEISLKATGIKEGQNTETIERDALVEESEKRIPEHNISQFGAVQKMIHRTLDVQKDSEINKIKEISLKVTGIKEEQNTETIERDVLVQESEKSIPEHNISQFDAVQKMIHKTLDVQKDSEINKLKEISLKVTGIKEEQNTEAIERDVLVQESEKSIPEHNISQFDAVQKMIHKTLDVQKDSEINKLKEISLKVTGIKEEQNTEAIERYVLVEDSEKSIPEHNISQFDAVQKMIHKTLDVHKDSEINKLKEISLKVTGIKEEQNTEAIERYVLVEDSEKSIPEHNISQFDAVQKMIHKTLDVHKDSEINKLKEISLKVTGIKEEQNTEAIERDVLVQESEKSIPEHNISQFDAVQKMIHKTLDVQKDSEINKLKEISLKVTGIKEEQNTEAIERYVLVEDSEKSIPEHNISQFDAVQKMIHKTLDVHKDSEINKLKEISLKVTGIKEEQNTEAIERYVLVEDSEKSIPEHNISQFDAVQKMIHKTLDVHKDSEINKLKEISLKVTGIKEEQNTEAIERYVLVEDSEKSIPEHNISQFDAVQKMIHKTLDVHKDSEINKLKEISLKVTAIKEEQNTEAIERYVLVEDSEKSIPEHNISQFDAVQKMIHKTLDVHKDSEINKLKEISLKVTGIKEEQNTEAIERDALVQESEKSIPEHNNSEFDAVESYESSIDIKFVVQESVMEPKCNKENKETPQRIRKSCRNQIRPLAYWKGERQLVKRLKSGDTRVSIIYEEENDDNEKSRKSWNAEKFLQKRNASKQKKISILNKKKGTKKIVLHTHYEDILSDNFSQNTGFNIVKTLESRHMSSGFFKIKAGHKTKDLTPEYDMHFVVMKGYVVLNISSAKLYLKCKDSFKVPKGNIYTLKNCGKSLAVLSFCSEK